MIHGGLAFRQYPDKTKPLMRIFTLSCVLSVLLWSSAYSQSITNYSFSATSGTFTALSSATATTGYGTGNVDEGYWNAIPLGFEFWYMGVRYTTISASTNGWLTLGANITNATPTNSLWNGGNPRPIIAPLWDDLNIQSGTNASFLTTGTAGSRIFTMQFLNFLWQSNANGSTISLQVKLYEGTGKIEYVYRPESANVKTPSASIGLAATGTGAGSFLSLNNAGTAPTVSSTSESSNIGTKPASGQTYAFTSPIPSAPASLTFSDVSSTAMSLNWVDNSSNENGFAIYRSTDGVTYSYVSQTNANATTSFQTGLSASSSYYWKVYAFTEGALSTAVSASQATLCLEPVISQIPSAGLVSNYRYNASAIDLTGNNNGTFQNSPTITANRFGIASKAYSFDGSTQYMSTATSYVNPAEFTISAWFKTTTTSGGKLIGFGNSQLGSSSNYDRHIYMNNAGQIYFGVYPGNVVTVNSSSSYNDNVWHLATATLSSTAGMALYVDGALVGTNTGTTTAQNFTGYWKVGYDNLNGWTSAPTSFYFNGVLDDILIYSRAITDSEAAGLYTSPDGAGNNGPVCAGSTLSLSATTISGATYAWSGPNGFTSTLQNPTFSYAAANAGTYTLQVTASACTATAYTSVISTSTTGQWTGITSTDWSDGSNWCSGSVPTSSTNVTITASATRMPVITTSVNCNNITINTGATLTTSLGGTLNIYGTLTNSGTMTNSGTTSFSGTSGQQSFTGTTSFYNLTVNNSNGLIIPTAITVNNNLTLTAGTLNANNFNLTVKGNWVNNVSTTAFTAGATTVTLNGTAAQSIGGTFATNFSSLTVAGTANTVTLNVNINIAANLSVSSGTFDLGSYTANRVTAGGTLTVANNAILKIGGTNTYPTNYATSTLVVASTVEYSGTNQSVTNVAYGNLLLSSASGAAVKSFPSTDLNVLGNLSTNLGAGTSVTFSAASNITVNGNVSLAAATIFNGSSFTTSVGGNWTNAGTFNGNTGTVILTGSGKTVSASGTQNFNNLTVAASAIVFSNSSINLSGNLVTSGIGSFTQASGGTLTMTGTGAAISGTGISIDNLTISGSVTTAASFAITGNLSVSGSFAASAGTVTMSGTTKTMSGAGSRSFYALSVTGSIGSAVDFSIASALTVNGSLTATAGTATFTGTSTLSGTANLFNSTVNGTSLQLSSNSILGVAGVLTITSGILNVTSSIPNTVIFNSTGAQNINAITYHRLVLSNGNTKTATGNFITNSHLTIDAGTTFNAGSYTLSIYGNWINNGSFTAATSTVQFLGAATTYLTGATTFNILTSNKSNTITESILQSNIAAATVNMTNGIITTGANTITITSTRTGNGFIYGNIQRTHAFTTGVDYAFEGPNNTINFSAVSSVSSITISVTKGSISDFPFGGSISRVYNITVPVGTYTATLRLHYEDDELNGNVESSMDLWQYNGSVWEGKNKTSNSTSANFLEKTGLTNISNRWTCSDNSNVVQWNGSVSTDWNTVDNWTVLQGSASRPPAATDIVNLGTTAFTNQPTINSTVSVKSIIFGSTQAVSLSITTGGTLTSGDISGLWSSNKTHTINANNQTMTINGSLSLSDGTSGHAINLNIGTGTVNVTGSINHSGGANVVFSAAGNLNIGGDYNYANGTFTASTGTVSYNGTSNQVIAPVNYNNLIISNAGDVLSINTATNIAGNLTVNAGELYNNATTTISGNVTIASGATLTNDHIINVGGNWNNSGTFNGNGIGVIFDGIGTQTISSSIFNNLEINKPVGSVAVLTGDVTIKGNLVGTSGTLDIGSYFFNRDVVGGTATISDNAILIIAADNAPNKFSNYYLSSGSTVVFNGTGTQNLMLPGLVYGNLIFRNSGTKILYTALSVMGNLTIESGATFNAGSNTISLNGNWVNSGTFTPGTSTLICTGTTKSLTGVTTFNKLTASGSYTFLSNLTFNGLLTISSTGSLSAGSSIITTLNGDLINSGILYNLGTTTFTGNVQQTLSLINAVQTVAITVNFNGTVPPVLNSTSTPQFGFLNINNTGGVSPSVGWTILYGMTVGTGATFNGGASSHNLLGSLTNNGTMTTTGPFSFIPGTATSINLGTGFTSTGRVYFGGAGAITLSGTPVSFANVNITNTNLAGISPSSNWMLTQDLTVVTGSVLQAGNNTYTIGGNIIDNGTINGGTSTFMLNGIADQEINSASSFYNFNLNKPSGNAWLSKNLSVNGNLNFTAGIVQTGAFLIAQSSAGSVTGAAQNTGWINGKLKKYISTGATSKSFEVGDAANYTPVAVAFSNVSKGGDLTAFTTGGDNPAITSSSINPAKSVNRFWTLTGNGATFNNYTATFNFVAGDIDAGASTSAFNVASHNGSSWSLPVTALPNLTNIQATGVTAFGDFAIGEICNKETTISYAGSPFCTNAAEASVTITGTTGGTFTSDAGLVINATTGSVNLSLSTTGDHIITYTIAGTNDCSQFITTANITIAVAGTWTGAVNTDWDNTGNWACGGVPTSTTDVTIPSGITNYPIIVSTKALNNITIQTGASIAVNNATLLIGGDLSGSGNFSSLTGTIELNGTTDQIIPAGFFTNNTVKNLIISNNVSLAGTDTLTGTLTITTGKTFTTNDNLILKSTATGSARIAQLPVDAGGVATAFITGKVSIERYIPQRNAWRLLAAPVAATGAPTINEAWQEGVTTASPNSNAVPGYGVLIQGGTVANGFDQGLTVNPTVKVYNNSNNTFYGLPAVPGTHTPITTYPGYFVFVRGDRSINLLQGANAAYTTTTLRMKGVIKTGSITTNVNATNYTVLGNPFPSAINFETITRNNVKNAFYVWDPKLAGTYGLGAYVTFIWNPATATYDATTSASPLSQYIASGEAVLIESGDGLTAGTITVKESDKSANGSDLVFGRTNGLNQKVRVNLHAVNANGTTPLLDGVLTNYDVDLSNAIDNDDAKKINGASENIGIKRDGKMLAIERRKTVTSSDTTFLNLYQMKIGNYRLQVEANQMDANNLTAVIKDSYSNTINNMPVNLNGETFIPFSINSDPASYALNRFSIVFKPNQVVLPVTFKVVKAYRQEKIVMVEWSTTSEVNVKEYEVERSADARDFVKLKTTAATATNGGDAAYKIADEHPLSGNNFYRIRSIDIDGQAAYSKTVQVALPVAEHTPTFSVYPNPVVSNTISIAFTGVEKGSYRLELINNTGAIIAARTVQHDGISAKIVFDVNQDFAAGKYELRLSGNGVVIVKTVFKK